MNNNNNAFWDWFDIERAKGTFVDMTIIEALETGWNAGQKAIVRASDPVDDKSREDSIKGELE